MNNIDFLRKIVRSKGFLKNVSIHRRVAVSGALKIDIELTLSSCKLNDEVILCFSNVEMLKIGQLQHNIAMQLEIYDIHERHFEYLHYLVADEEHGILSFWCESINIM